LPILDIFPQFYNSNLLIIIINRSENHKQNHIKANNNVSEKEEEGVGVVAVEGEHYVGVVGGGGEDEEGGEGLIEREEGVAGFGVGVEDEVSEVGEEENEDKHEEEEITEAEDGFAQRLEDKTRASALLEKEE
jgi:hypothetical protein